MTARADQPDVRGGVVALCGGVGGAKLAAGLAEVLGDELTVVVNTGDDFEHLGLSISPDLDTVLYTLGGLADRERGWGRAGETWSFMDALSGLGGEDWFRLGDKDLALHVERTRRLRAGETLSAVAADVARRFGIAAAIVPMSDDRVRTLVETEEGVLAFQRYFVERRAEPKVRAIRFEGAAAATPSTAAARALRDPKLRAVIVCPSNPYLSVDPILAVPELRRLVEACAAPVVAVSPIIGGKAVKGPTAKIMAELGAPLENSTIARHYAGLIDGLVIDASDEADAAALGLPAHVRPTLMRSDQDRASLARETLAFADEIAAGRASGKRAAS